MHEPLLSIKDLRVSYRDVEALHGISIDVYPGETVSLVGESGSGKSTTAMSIIGLLSTGGRVSGGEILFDGVDLAKLSNRQMRTIRGAKIGLIPQDPMLSLNPVIKIGKQIDEILLLHTKLTGAERRDRVLELLNAAGLRNPRLIMEQYPHQLSGGMRQRVLISIAIACDPQLIIADEPTSALDVTVQRQILDHIEKVCAANNASVLLITHDLAVAGDRSHRIAVMNKGEIVEEGTSDQILLEPRDRYTKKLIAAAPSMSSQQLFQHNPQRDLTTPMLKVAGLVKTFATPHGGAPFKAVDEVSFVIPRGETLAIVGESGSGKSTTARLVVRLDEPDEGSIALNGEEMLEVRGEALRKARARFQMIYQDPYGSLNPRMTIGQVLEEPMRIHGIGASRADRTRRVKELLELVTLPSAFAERRPRELSGGQRQRVAIARALSVEPELIVCDEPVSALDVSVQAQILDLLVSLQKEKGLTYLFISHDLAVVRQLAHEVVVMQKGRVVECGATVDIFTNPRDEYTKELLAAIPGGRIAPVRDLALIV